MKREGTVQHFVRYSLLGVEYGPFSDEDRADLEASARVPLFWRSEVGEKLPFFYEPWGAHG